ncbi:RecQ family ATP-dependent DNA helicase [soil metagenome]
MTNSFGRALELLRAALDDPAAEFRDGQLEAVEALVDQRARLLIVQRTGWGKSMVYFLTTRLLRDRGAGPTLLISPLLALMRDQIKAARRLSIRAATINSSNTGEWNSVVQKLEADEVDVLLISPERLSNDEFRQNVLMEVADRVGFFVVDEAHCISDWGHDFRPDYLRVTRVLQALPPNIPVLTTTATANDRVVRDVKEQLGSDLRVLRGPLIRESLQLQNIVLPRQTMRMAWLAEQIPRLSGSGIVYTLTIADAQRLANWLLTRNIDAHAYWGGLETEAREDLEERLLNNEVKVLVATTALAMGFDKPDLGFVIHYQRPGSAVHYYQQVGRAGRALRSAHGVLLSGDEDQEITEYFIRSAFPPEAHAREVLEALKAAEDGLSMPMLQRQMNLTKGQIERVLKSLVVKAPAPVSKQGPRWYANPVPYTPDREKVERITSLRHLEQARMQEYMQSRECLMLFLARELDDPAPTPCGRCAVCRGGPPLPEAYSSTFATEAAEFLRRTHQPVEPRKQWPGDALMAHGWRGNIPMNLRAEEGRALCLWGDGGWGESARRDKHEIGRYSDELVVALAEMVRERWRPLPSPSWVTCIPSLERPDLVPDLAERVASLLELPFVQCVRKKFPTRSQESMENSYQQAHNLENVFEIKPREVRTGPVLLVDDLVDSRWTFTVVAAHLLEQGSGPVLPLALAMTTGSSR